jgi:hypothetical protein
MGRCMTYWHTSLKRRGKNKEIDEKKEDLNK